MMHHLGKYSGNMTDVENGHLLTEMYDSRDYVRLYTEIATANPASLPSLWVFLLLILGILLVIIAVTSLLMHYIQRKHRQALLRRVANGEVDLEALGIKRLTVPQEVVEKMPLFIYVASDEEILERPISPSPIFASTPQQATETIVEESSHSSDPTLLLRPTSDPNHLATPFPAPPSSLVLTSSTPTDYVTTTLPARQSCVLDRHFMPTAVPLPSKLPHRQLPYSQPSCPICLDDFVSHETIVRELTCGHIFHPECVDTFLRDNSSLCPMCKKSVLPKGYCPANVTNAMVRRERLLRRMRERITVEVIANDIGTPAPQRPVVAGRRMASFHRQFGRAARANARRTSSAPMPSTVEMAQTSSGTPVAAASRRDWARRRASAMLGTQTTMEDEEREREAGTPKCRFTMTPRVCSNAYAGVVGRKAIGTVFPGFR